MIKLATDILRILRSCRRPLILFKYCGFKQDLKALEMLFSVWRPRQFMELLDVYIYLCYFLLLTASLTPPAHSVFTVSAL